MSLFQNEAEQIAAKSMGGAVNLTNSRLAAAQASEGIDAQRAASGLAGMVMNAVTKNRWRRGFGGAGGSTGDFWSTRTPIMGGVSPKEAKEIFENVHGQKYARKNLWLIEVTSNLNNGEQDIPGVFNLFATEVNYSPCIMTGEAVKIGGANYDAVRGHEPSELSITTYDDATGTIKKWFAAHHHAASAHDGTVNEPASYAIKFRIVHSAIKNETASGAFEVTGYFRPTNMECTLSRSDDGMEEVQMTFAQLDTFMRP